MVTLRGRRRRDKSFGKGKRGRWVDEGISVGRKWTNVNLNGKINDNNPGNKKKCQQDAA